MNVFRLHLLFCLLSQFCIGQNDQLASLKSKLPSLNEDTNKVLVLKDIGFYFHFSNPDSGLIYSKQGLKLAEKIGWQKGIASSYNSIGVNYNAKTEYTNALEAHKYALQIREKLKDSKAIAASLGNIGLIYESLADYPSALEYQQKGLKIFTALNNLKMITLSYVNIGNIYDKIGDYKKALSYQSNALGIAKSLNNEELLVLAYSNIGNIYLKLENYDSAFVFQNKGIELSNISGNIRATLDGYGNLGIIAAKKRDFSKAIEYQEQCLKLAAEISDEYSLGMAKNNLSGLYFNLGQYDKSIQIGESALEIARRIKALDIEKESHRLLSLSYEKKTDVAQSYNHFKDYIKLRDIIFSDENTKLLTTKELQFEFEKEMDKRKLQEDKRKSLSLLELKKQKQIRYLFTAALILTMVLLFFVYKSYKQKTKINIELGIKNKTIEHQKKEITDSINYAKRIQNAILPDLNLMKTELKNSFVLYEPKDIVSGDFFFFKKQQDEISIACADCTGHGVPGAFMSMIGMKELQIANEKYNTPSEILHFLNIQIKETLKQNNIDGTRDGMDIAFCKITGTKVLYSGANRPLWILKKEATSIEEVKSTKVAIGGFTDNDQHFENHTIECNAGDTLYMFSDGYADQFGGNQNKKLTTKKLKNLLLSFQNETMEYQHSILKSFILEWRGENEQIDDVLVIGIRI